jgi:hypothetical protein
MRLLTNATAAEISAALESAGIDARVLTTEEETESQHARQEEYMLMPVNRADSADDGSGNNGRTRHPGRVPFGARPRLP